MECYGNSDTLSFDRAVLGHQVLSCEPTALRGCLCVDQTTSLQNRRNSQLTHGRRLAGASGIRSPTIAARMFPTVCRTFCRSAGVMETISD